MTSRFELGLRESEISDEAHEQKLTGEMCGEDGCRQASTMVWTSGVVAPVEAWAFRCDSHGQNDLEDEDKARLWLPLWESAWIPTKEWRPYHEPRWRSA